MTTKEMAKRNTIRLTESELKRVINESTRRVLKEYTYPHEFYGVAHHKGSFETALYDAYRKAGARNAKRLEDAF